MRRTPGELPEHTPWHFFLDDDDDVGADTDAIAGVIVVCWPPSKKSVAKALYASLA
jgi:hypothetical protein